jgi:hypothetical protein
MFVKGWWSPGKKQMQNLRRCDYAAHLNNFGGFSNVLWSLLLIQLTVTLFLFLLVFRFFGSPFRRAQGAPVALIFWDALGILVACNWRDIPVI